MANHLRADGVDCTIDQYILVPPEGWPRWMDKQIRDSNFVVMVRTEIYCQRVMGHEEPGKGLGVHWEGYLIYQAIYNAEAMNTKFIPVLFKSGDRAHIPAPVQSTTFYFAQTDDGYEDLYRRLTSQPRTITPALGKLRSLPPAERKSEGTAGSNVVISNIPEPSPFFTGRERELEQLHELLLGSTAIAVVASIRVITIVAMVENTRFHPRLITV